MKRFFSMAAGLLLGSTAAWAQYTNILEGGVTQTVTNDWSVGSFVWVGNSSSTNALNLISNVTVTSSDVLVGTDSNAMVNTILMTQTSRWDIAGRLTVGEGTDNQVSVLNGSTLSASSIELHAYNTLQVDDGGSIEGLQSMNVYSNAILTGDGTVGFGTNDALMAFFGTNISLGADLVFSAAAGYSNTLSYNDGELDVSSFNPLQFENFNTLALSGSDLTGSGTLDTFERIDMTGGMIDPAGDSQGTLEIGGDFTANGTTYRAQVDTSAHDALIFTGPGAVDLLGLSLDLAVSGMTTGTVSILSSGAGLNNGFVSTNIIARPLLYTATLVQSNNDVFVVLETDDTTKLSTMLDFAATESVRAGFNGMKSMVFTRAKQLRRNLVSTVHAIPNEVYLLTTTNAPAGAEGPGDLNTIFDMHVWVQHYNGQGDYDRYGATDAFVLDNNGSTIGADRLIGDSLAVGFNYTYARSAARTDSDGDRLDSETYWLGAYGEWVGEAGLYVDALVACGLSSYETERFADSYHGTAAYDGLSFGGYADIGQYYYYGDNLALSPYMGLHALTLTVDGHQEIEDAGSVLQVDEVDRTWLESAIGMKMRHRFDTGIGRFQTTGYAEWLYDFIQDDVSASLSSGGLAAKQTDRINPDDSGINAGIGCSWICTDYMEVGIGYNGRFSDNYEEHTASVMFDIMF